MAKKKEKFGYVSRGGKKLEGALDEFKVPVEGKVALDVGASTGGFTDCLLKRGARLVYTVDVGYGILDWKLRNDPRVVVHERTNIRNVTPENLYEKKEKASLAVIDVSFISLTKVMPVVYTLLADAADVLALIKPQFEAKREDVERGGIVRSEEVRSSVIKRIEEKAKEIGFEVKGVVISQIEGADGNIEYIIWLAKR
ncbi:MAG: TlyA family RNA methyltransferase [Candidatus Margulisiibacteriota bacterium]